jgi:AcrR family transcriptional regulator
MSQRAVADDETRAVVAGPVAADGTPATATRTTARGRAKAERRTALLRAAAHLFARRGFDGVSLEDLGSAVGVSGPAVYRHFASKQAVLAALLLDASERLLVGGRGVVEQTPGDDVALRSLIAFHTDFALTEPDVIRVQDRDLAALSADDREAVRELQRTYVDLWVDVLSRLSPAAEHAELRLRAQATFGLLNSTPFSARGLSEARMRELLEEMALASLGRPSG